jgi:MFS family permease
MSDGEVEQSAAAKAPAGVSRGLALLVAGAFFMEILDATVIAPAAPHIAMDLGVAAVDVNVAITAYVLTLAVLIPVSGWLAARFGARPVFLTAIAIFTLASVGCAAAIDLTTLTATRVIQGIGGAMIVPVGRLVVLRATAKTELVTAIAYLTWPALVPPSLPPPSVASSAPTRPGGGSS